MVEKSGKNLIPIAMIIAGLIIAGAIVFVNQKKITKSPEILSPQKVGEKVISYLNENILKGQATSSLVGEVKEENGLYKLTIKIGDQEFSFYTSQDGKLLFTNFINLEEESEENELTIGNFSVSQDEICKENEKPIIYFFGSQSCPHCRWEHPIVEKVAKNFEGYISFRNNMDSNADQEIFSKYSEGSIPTLVFGCRYYRVGSGERIGEEEETKVLTALMCKLTQNQPQGICDSVKDLIDKI